MKDKISIIIPIYNVEKYLRQCLDSIVNQTFKDIEIICINDCSPDNSLSIIKEYAEKDNRIKIVDLKENLGLGGARNEGLKIATGKYAMFVDSDDWLELNACEEAYNCIEKNQSDITVFNYYKSLSSGEKTIDENKLSILEIGADKNGKIDFSLIDLPYLYTAQVWYKIYRLAFLNENDLRMIGRNFEDACFSVQALMLTRNVSICNKALYNYRIDNNSSITCNAKNYKDCITARKLISNYIIENCKDKKYLNSFFVRNTSTLFHWFKKYEKQLNNEDKKEFYSGVRNIFKLTVRNGDMNYIKNHIDYFRFLTFVYFESYFIYHFFDKILFKIFSISNGIFSTRYTLFFIKWSRKKDVKKAI